MLYNSGIAQTRAQLHDVPIPPRTDVGRLWEGVNHGVLADTIVNYCTKVGLSIQSEGWYTNPNGSALFGAIDLDTSNTDFALNIPGSPATFSLGVRHDNLGRYAISFAVGARIAFCANGMFSGDFVLKHRHLRPNTQTISKYRPTDPNQPDPINANRPFADLPYLSEADLRELSQRNLEDTVAEGVENYLQELDSVQLLAVGMQQVPMDDRDASYAIMKAGERGIFKWRHLETVYDKWINPPHPEFEPRNLYSLYNAATETIKQFSPAVQFNTLKRLRSLVDDYTQIAADQQEIHLSFN